MNQLFRTPSADDVSKQFRSFTPEFALIVHTRNDDERAVATAHPIRAVAGGRPEIGEGRAINDQVRAQVVALLTGREQRIGLIPANLLLADVAGVAWYSPPAKRSIHLRLGERSHRLDIVAPPLVFRAAERRLFVAALGRDGRPDNEAVPLFHAPFWNVFDSGLVCMGDARLPRHSTADAIHQWETAFWLSAFSHVNHSHTLATKPEVSTEALFAFWRNKLRRSRRPAVKVLAPMHTTLTSWLSRTAEERR